MTLHWIQPSQPQNIDVSAGDAIPSEACQGSILIVDDTLDSLLLLSHSLVQKGYNVHVVRSGRSALEWIKTEIPTLVLLDVGMTDIDGYDICQQLKANPETAHIPVIFVSEIEDVPSQVKAFDLGAVDYITKPFQPLEVIARVTAHLRLGGLQQQLQQDRQQLIQENRLLQAELQNRLASETSLQLVNQELERLAYLDDVTCIANRLRFNQTLEQEWRRSQRQQKPISLILCDVDRFKDFNDAFGHQAGDQCLHQVASTIQGIVQRPGDLVARYGGEEFAVILPNTPSAGALKVANNIQRAVSALQIQQARSHDKPYLSLSFGVATVLPSLQSNPDQLIKMADDAISQAKVNGRDQIISRDETPFPLLDYLMRAQLGLEQPDL